VLAFLAAPGVVEVFTAEDLADELEFAQESVAEG